MRNVADKHCKENQNSHFVFNNFFFKNCAVYEIMLKITTESSGHRWQYGACAVRVGYV